MLTLVIPGEEFFDQKTSTFVSTEETTIRLEHSLASMSKWESFFEKPFLSTSEKTDEEVLMYVRYMILDEDYPENIFDSLTMANVKEIHKYIDSAQSATTFGEMPNVKKSRGEVITTELIYYFMVSFNIPFECENWHLNRLFSLIKICNIKNSKPPKMSRADIAKRNHELNAQRRAQLNTKG